MSGYRARPRTPGVTQESRQTCVTRMPGGPRIMRRKLRLNIVAFLCGTSQCQRVS